MGQLVKWLGGGESLDDLVARCRKMDLARQAPRTMERRGRARDDIALPELSPRGSVSRYNRPAIIELPRWCAVYDELWLAAYEPGRNGEYEFVTGRELPKYQQSRYSEENIITLPRGFRASPEQCACCQTWTLSGNIGAVECSRCNQWVCYGRTSRGGNFRCRESCGEIGQLGRIASDRTGLVPGRRGGNFGTL